MTLGNRCDEIVRLIDDTLDSLRAPRPLRRRLAEPTTAARSAMLDTPSDPGPQAA